MNFFKKYALVLIFIATLFSTFTACSSKSSIKANIGLMNATKESYSLCIGDVKEPKAENKIEASGLKFFPTNINGTKDKTSGSMVVKTRLQLNAFKDDQLVSRQFIEIDKTYSPNETLVITWDGKSFLVQETKSQKK